MPSASPFIGIDFGTSKCAMAWYDPEARRAETIYSDGKEEVPSIVYVRNQDDIRVGEPAERLLDDVANEIRLRTSENSAVDLHRFFISIKRNLVGQAPRIIDGRPYHPEDIVSKILEKLRTDAENGHFKTTTNFRYPISRAVITHPADFSNDRKEKIRKAAQMSGFSTIEFLAEPEAAAIAYAHAGLKVGQCMLVYDFGGGTFDVAVLRREASEKFRQIIPARGNVECGGDSIDRILYDHFDALARKRVGLSFSRNGQLNTGIRRYCRRIKESLSVSSAAETFSTYISDGSKTVYFEEVIDRSVFEELIRPTIQKTVALTQQALNEAQKQGYAVDTVALVGGSSKLPLVVPLLKDILQIGPEPRVWNKGHIAVALGASYYAEQCWGAPFAEYRKAVYDFWQPARQLTGAQVQQLSSMATIHQFTANETDNIEYAVMGYSKAEVLQLQYQQACSQYRDALIKLQSKILQDKTFSQSDVAGLTTRQNELGINQPDAETIEREVMRDTKERVWEYYHREAKKQYHSSVEVMKQAGFPALEQIETLKNTAMALALSQEETATIEQEVLNDTKENYYTRLHQEARKQYRGLVIEAWQTNALTSDQVNMLTTKAKEFHLSEQETWEIEIGVMRHRKETILKLQEYRRLVQEAWKTKNLSQDQANKLESKAREFGLRQNYKPNQNYGQDIEREVMGHTIPTIMNIQHYRNAVRSQWSKKLLTLSQLNSLYAQRKTLGITDDLAETIEREEMGDTAKNIAERYHADSLQRYRQSAQEIGAQLEALHTLAKDLELKGGETAEIHRELIPALLPHPILRADKIFPLVVFISFVVLAAGSVGFAISQQQNTGNANSTIGWIIFLVIGAVVSLVWFVHRPGPDASASSTSRPTSRRNPYQASAPLQQQHHQQQQQQQKK